MNINQSAAEVLKKPLIPTSENGLYVWLIVGCSLGGAVILTILIALLIYITRRLKKKKKGSFDSSGYIPGAEFCPQQMMSSFSSSTSDDVSDGPPNPVAKQFRRPLGPSTSLDPPALLRLTQECVQPRPALTRWHTVATPHCQTATVPGTLDVERDSEDDDPLHPPCIHGRLWFSLLYKPDTKGLQVTVIKAKYLPGRGLVNIPRDPFVKVFLLPDEEHFHQTKIRKRTLDPKYMETFEFNVSAADIPKRTLKLSVYDVDKKKVRHCLGHVLFPLTKNDMKSGDVIWKDLEMAPQASAALGDIQLCLSCNPSNNRIKTTICRVRNLQGISLNDAVVYVKVQLYHGRKMMKCKRTVPQSLSTNQKDLTFDETFSFAVSGRFFDSCSFGFTVMVSSSTPLVKDAPHGGVVIGPFMYARGEQLQHWQEMLSNSKNTVMRWHPLEKIRK